MNNERRLQITKHLVVNLDGLNDKFESAYSLDGVHILPPLMTDIKRMEMQQLRLQALAIERSLKRNKPYIAERQIKCLMPRMVNAATNTALTENLNSSSNPNPYPKPNPVPVSTSQPTTTPAPLVVLGRFRQELQKSETAIYDHSRKELISVAPAKETLPISRASHEVIEASPQRAVFLPVAECVLGTMRSSFVPKIHSVQGSTTTIDLRVRTGQERMPERPVVFPSSPQIQGAPTKMTEGRFRSRIPIRRHRAAILTTSQTLEVGVSGHGSCHERNDVKANSANERRRNYGAKVALKRNEMARKREELAKLKPPPRTNNLQVPKSIRTPIRRMVEGESQLEQQRFQIQETPSTYNNNNQVPKSIRTPIRRVEADREETWMDQQGSRFQSFDQQTLSARSNNNQVPKSIRTPIRRVEGGESPHLQIQESPRIDNKNNQVPKSIRTPIRRMESGFEDQKENLFQPLDQQPASTSKTDNNQVPKSIRTPIRRMEAGSEESDLLRQMHLFQSLASRQKAEQERLQAQLEEQQQGLIDQLVGQITRSDIKETTNQVVLDPEQ